MDDEEDEQGKEQGKGHDHRQEQDVKGSGMIRISGRSRRGTSMDRKTMMKNTRISRGKSRSRKIRRTMKSARSFRQHVRSQPHKMETATNGGGGISKGGPF